MTPSVLRLEIEYQHEVMREDLRKKHKLFRVVIVHGRSIRVVCALVGVTRLGGISQYTN